MYAIKLKWCYGKLLIVPLDICGITKLILVICLSNSGTEPLFGLQFPSCCATRKLFYICYII